MIRNSNHMPVLLHEVIRVLNPKPGEFFVDATLGGGGHAREILKLIGDSGLFLGIDLDRYAAQSFSNEISNVKNAQIVFRTYADLIDILRRWKLPKVDCLLIDLGFSSDQIDVVERGFSFRKDGPLDMRYDDTNGMTAGDAVNSLSEKKLSEIIKTFGEDRFADRISKAIVSYRKQKLVTRTTQLADIILHAIPRFWKDSIHPATRTFQALRIFVNHELENLEKILSDIPKIMNTGGRVSIISFHSLEDRIVKKAFLDFSKEGKAKLIIKKPIVPQFSEQKSNPRSRSAKLRGIKMN